MSPARSKNTKSSPTIRRGRNSRPKPVSAKKVQPTFSGQALTPSYDQIAKHAYMLWEQRGYTHGHDQEDWFHAEAELGQKYKV